MATKKNTTNNLLRNAHSIAKLYQEGVTNVPYSQGLVNAINKLTSLYAFQETDDVTKRTLSDMANTNEGWPEGL